MSGHASGSTLAQRLREARSERSEAFGMAAMMRNRITELREAIAAEERHLERATERIAAAVAAEDAAFRRWHEAERSEHEARMGNLRAEAP